MGWLSRDTTDLQWWAAPARPFDGAPASADLRQGERPHPKDGFTPRRTPKAHPPEADVPLAASSTGSGAGMTREKGVWGFLGMGRIGSAGSLPARPFDGAPASADLRQGERPHPKDGFTPRRTPKAHPPEADVPLAASSTGSGAGMTREKGVWGFLGTRQIGRAVPPPARPFDGAQGERPHPRDGFRLSAAGMTGEKGVWGFLGTRRIGSAGPPPPLDPSTVLPPRRIYDRVSGPSPRMDSRLGARHRRTLPRRTFRLQHLRPALGGRNDGGRGWGLWKGLSVWTPSRGYNILAP